MRQSRALNTGGWAPLRLPGAVLFSTHDYRPRRRLRGPACQRLLEGLAASIREKGLAQTQVTDIVGHARASRRTFYKHFPDKESCFVELTDMLSLAMLLDQVARAIDREAPAATQIDQAIDTYVDILLNEPSLLGHWASPGLGERVVIAQRESASSATRELLVSVISCGRRARSGPRPALARSRVHGRQRRPAGDHPSGRPWRGSCASSPARSRRS